MDLGPLLRAATAPTGRQRPSLFPTRKPVQWSGDAQLVGTCAPARSCDMGPSRRRPSRRSPSRRTRSRRTRPTNRSRRRCGRDRGPFRHRRRRRRRPRSPAVRPGLPAQTRPPAMTTAHPTRAPATSATPTPTTPPRRARAQSTTTDAAEVADAAETTTAAVPTAAPAAATAAGTTTDRSTAGGDAAARFRRPYSRGAAATRRTGRSGAPRPRPAQDRPAAPSHDRPDPDSTGP